MRSKRQGSPSQFFNEELEINYQTLASQGNEKKLTIHNYKRYLKKTPERGQERQRLK